MIDPKDVVRAISGTPALNAGHILESYVQERIDAAMNTKLTKALCDRSVHEQLAILLFSNHLPPDTKYIDHGWHFDRMSLADQRLYLGEAQRIIQLLATRKLTDRQRAAAARYGIHTLGNAVYTDLLLSLIDG